MIGGLGDDTYYVDNINDQVIENANQGTDTIQSSISQTLGEHIENLTLLDFSKAEKGRVDGEDVLVYGFPKRNELDYIQGDAIENYKGTCALTSIANLITQTGTPTTKGKGLMGKFNNGAKMPLASLGGQLGGFPNYPTTSHFKKISKLTMMLFMVTTKQVLLTCFVAVVG
ncbi:MAG: hypothetical protein H0A76_04410 [Candidatus Thiodubiliella endoseptemdiera]|uniref:Uncharacterized protein n=1 Tax=Candidatus Thiodubiliella endoseptemdiera TaxID=2738886 RepID=A0A853F0L0_9GAMM|nr:hypothetical protein [Candidatus Thiodubiliella endoseptemdiera]